MLRCLSAHLHLMLFILYFKASGASRVLFYCPCACTREDNYLLKAVWREKRAQTENFLPAYTHFGAKEHTSSSTHLRHNRLLFTKEFIIIFAFFIVCFVFLSCGVSSKLFFSFFWLQFGERNHQEFFGPVIEHGCSNRCLCFVSIDVLIH